MTLFEINEQLQNCFRVDEETVVNGETGEVFDSQYLDELLLSKEEKITNLCKWVKNLDSDIKQLKEQKELFARREDALKHKRDSLANYIKLVLEGEKFEAPDKSVQVSYRKSEKVDVLNIWDIPEEYRKYAEPTADKARIKDAIKNGDVVPGASIVQTTSMLIK